MPRTCGLCRHEKLSEINEAIIAGKTFRDVARQFETTKDAVARHKRHLAREIAENTSARAAEANALAQRASTARTLEADDLLGQVLDLIDEAQAAIDDAKRAGKLRDRLLAIETKGKQLRTRAEIQGKIQSGAQVNVVLATSSEWVALQARIVAALGPFPEARAAVLAAIAGPDGVRSLPAPPTDPAAVPDAPGAVVVAGDNEDGTRGM